MADLCLWIAETVVVERALKYYQGRGVLFHLQEALEDPTLQRTSPLMPVFFPPITPPPTALQSYSYSTALSSLFPVV